MADDNSLAESAKESPAPSGTTKSKKSESKVARDPVTGQTLDMVRKKKMTQRYEAMLDDRGLAYRIDGMERLTRIQAASMVHRNQKHIEAVETSEEVMSFVFDHRAGKPVCVRRGEKLISDHEHLIKSFEKRLEAKNGAILHDKDQFDENGNKKTDGMERFGSEMEMLELLESGVVDEKSAEFVQFTDDWLAKLQSSLTALQKDGEESLKLIGEEPGYIFADQDELTYHSARCRPVRYSRWPDNSDDVQPDEPMDIPEIDDCARCRPIENLSQRSNRRYGPAQMDVTNVVFNPSSNNARRVHFDEPVITEEVDTCARCRAVEVLSRRPILNYDPTEMDVTNDVFSQLNYAPNTLEDQLELHLEKMGLQFC